MAGNKASAKYLKFAVYLAVVVLLNVACTTLFFRIDLTENQAYSLSEASKRVVSNLSEPLTIKVFFSRNLPAPHNATERYLHDLLEEYAAYANENFNYRFHNVSTETGDLSPEAEENKRLAENYGVHPIQIQVIEQDEVKFQKAYMGLVLIHGDIIERLPTITDVDGLEYRLTTAIQKLNNKISALLALEGKIHVRLYLSSSLETVAPYMGLEGLRDVPEKIRKTVEELNAKNYGKIAFDYLDPAKSPLPDGEIRKYNLLQLTWPAVPEKNIAAGSGVSGLVMRYKTKELTMPLIQVIRLPLIGTKYVLTDMEQIQDHIDANLANLIDIHEDLGVLAGHGSLDIPGSAASMPNRRQPDETASFRSLIRQNYTLKAVQPEEGIPEGIHCLLIAGPTDSFSDYDLFQIDQFLMKGKNLALFLDAFEEIQPQGMMGRTPPQYKPVETGLEKLLAHYGVRLQPAYVLDENCFQQRVPEHMGGGQRDIYFAPLIQNRFIRKNLDFMKNIKGMIALKASPLSLDETRLQESEVTAHLLFSSSERSWEMAAPVDLNPMLMRPPSSPDSQRSYPLAYILEGRFPSYFAGESIPERPAEENPPEKLSGEEPSPGITEEPAAEKPSLQAKASDMTGIEEEGAVISEGKPGKILIVGSSEMLKDSILTDEGRSPNAIFVMNAIDYLNNREDIARMRSKEQQFNPLVETGPGLKATVKAFNIVGLPALVAVFGLLVWSRRHSRKKKIEMMFATASR